MLGVVATMQVKEGQEKAFETAMRDLQRQVQANEPGCKLYALHRAKAPRTYVMLERYESKAAFDAHGKTAHFQAAFPKLGALLAAPPKIEVLEEVA